MSGFEPQAHGVDRLEFGVFESDEVLSLNNPFSDVGSPSLPDRRSPGSALRMAARGIDGQSCRELATLYIF